MIEEELPVLFSGDVSGDAGGAAAGQEGLSLLENQQAIVDDVNKDIDLLNAIGKSVQQLLNPKSDSKTIVGHVKIFSERPRGDHVVGDNLFRKDGKCPEQIISNLVNIEPP